MNTKMMLDELNNIILSALFVMRDIATSELRRQQFHEQIVSDINTAATIDYSENKNFANRQTQIDKCLIIADTNNLVLEEMCANCGQCG